MRLVSICPIQFDLIQFIQNPFSSLIMGALKGGSCPLSWPAKNSMFLNFRKIVCLLLFLGKKYVLVPLENLVKPTWLMYTNSFQSKKAFQFIFYVVIHFPFKNSLSVNSLKCHSKKAKWQPCEEGAIDGRVDKEINEKNRFRSNR